MAEQDRVPLVGGEDEDIDQDDYMKTPGLEHIRSEKEYQREFPTTASSPFAKFLHPPHTYYLASIFIITSLSLAIIAIILNSRIGDENIHLPPVPNDDLPPLCGSSPSEARAMGCTFDIFVNGWMPAACYDRYVASDSESSSSYLAPEAAGASTFPVYWDQNFTKPATHEDLEIAAFQNGEEGVDAKFYTVYDYHRAHCMHLWRLSGSAVERMAKGEKGVGVYYKVASYEHTVHCNKVIVDREKDPGKTDTIIPGVCRCVGLDEVWNESHAWGGRPK